MDRTVDQAYKFGCGRYIQSENALEQLGAEVKRIGTKAFVVGGKRALEAAGERCFSSLKEAGCEYETVVWPGFACLEGAKEMARKAEEAGADVIVGVGGGRIMDFAKMIAANVKAALINVPTIASTCAAFTPLSVVYTPEGKTIGSWFFRREIDAVLVDETLLSMQPVRYMAAGILDSLAKKIEIGHYTAQSDEKLPYDLALSRVVAEHIEQELSSRWEEAANDLERGLPTQTLKDFFYLLIPQTGIVSGCARGAKQSALGHVLYEQVRVYYPTESAHALHGEIVGVGLRMQLVYLNQPELLRQLEDFMRRLHTPMRLEDIGVSLNDEFMERYIQYVISIGMVPDSEAENERIRQAMRICYGN